MGKKSRRVNSPMTKDKLELMKEMHRILFLNFTCRELSDKSGVTYTSISTQKTRGKVSGESAKKICKIASVKALGITRESLRPDIHDWGTDD